MRWPDPSDVRWWWYQDKISQALPGHNIPNTLPHPHLSLVFRTTILIVNLIHTPHRAGEKTEDSLARTRPVTLRVGGCKVMIISSVLLLSGLGHQCNCYKLIFLMFLWRVWRVLRSWVRLMTVCWGSAVKELQHYRLGSQASPEVIFLHFHLLLARNN